MRIKGGLDDPISDSPHKRQRTTDEGIIYTRDSIAQGNDDPLWQWIRTLGFWNADFIYNNLRNVGVNLTQIPSMSDDDFKAAQIPLGAIKTIRNQLAELKSKSDAGSFAAAASSPPPAPFAHPSVQPFTSPVAPAAPDIPIPSGIPVGPHHVEAQQTPRPDAPLTASGPSPLALQEHRLSAQIASQQPILGDRGSSPALQQPSQQAQQQVPLQAQQTVSQAQMQQWQARVRQQALAQAARQPAQSSLGASAQQPTRPVVNANAGKFPTTSMPVRCGACAEC
jgi:hypothetical protein